MSEACNRWRKSASIIGKYLATKRLINAWCSALATLAVSDCTLSCVGGLPTKLRSNAVDASSDSLDLAISSSSEFLLLLSLSRKCSGKNGFSSGLTCSAVGSNIVCALGVLIIRLSACKKAGSSCAPVT